MKTFSINEDVDISNFLQTLPNINDTIEDANKIILSLNSLRDKDCISYGMTTSLYGRSGLPTHGGGSPLSSYVITASIKQGGFDYLIQKEKQCKEDRKVWQKPDWWKEQILKWGIVTLLAGVLGYIIIQIKSCQGNNPETTRQKTTDTLKGK